jgi:ParB family chromosome partitioning protein
MASKSAQKVEMILIEQIFILNPRSRNRQVFNEIVDNISTIGLKRPITVSRRAGSDVPTYDLVCGQGRLEACKALGHREVPALVVAADEEDCLVASLVENCARRQHRAMDLLRDIGGMKVRGYSPIEIARKTGLSDEYVHGIIHLLENGEERLLRGVSKGLIPIGTAISISRAKDDGVQAALQVAYESNMLRGRKLLAARRLVEQRKLHGKGIGIRRNGPRKAVSPSVLLRAYREDTDRKNEIIARSRAAKARLLFITGAMRTLMDDDLFCSILESEVLATLPENLGKRVLSTPSELT